MFKELMARWKSWHLVNDVNAGRVQRGRQPEPTQAAVTEPIPVLRVRVYRAATGVWEDVV